MHLRESELCQQLYMCLTTFFVGMECPREMCRHVISFSLFFYSTSMHEITPTHSFSHVRMHGVLKLFPQSSIKACTCQHSKANTTLHVMYTHTYSHTHTHTPSNSKLSKKIKKIKTRPGPPGPAGMPGKPGLNGTPGKLYASSTGGMPSANQYACV
jgi:hypothetical protein